MRSTADGKYPKVVHRHNAGLPVAKQAISCRCQKIVAEISLIHPDGDERKPTSHPADMEMPTGTLFSALVSIPTGRNLIVQVEECFNPSY
jgi:hypothetical protein